MQSFNKAKARAEEALNHFEELENEDFLTYKQKDSAPEWVRDMCYEAHGSGDYLPDNYIYRWIVDALEIIRECTTEDEAEERIHELEPFPYHKNLTLWLDSNILMLTNIDPILGHLLVNRYIRRIQYLEDAAREGAIENILSFAQYLEIQEVAFTVLNFLREAEEEEAEED